MAVGARGRRGAGVHSGSASCSCGAGARALGCVGQEAVVPARPPRAGGPCQRGASASSDVALSTGATARQLSQGGAWFSSLGGGPWMAAAGDAAAHRDADGSIRRRQAAVRQHVAFPRDSFLARSCLRRRSDQLDGGAACSSNRRQPTSLRVRAIETVPWCSTSVARTAVVCVPAPVQRLLLMTWRSSPLAARGKSPRHTLATVNV